MRDGFPANLEYFKLDFLDKNQVALGRQFREILPLLWLRAGAVGARPELPADAPIPAMLIPDANPFAVLVDETRFADFLEAVSGRSDLTHLFLVTDSEDAFREMAEQLAAPARHPALSGLPGELHDQPGRDGMKVTLFDFQEDALAELHKKLKQARALRVR